MAEGRFMRPEAGSTHSARTGAAPAQDVFADDGWDQPGRPLLLRAAEVAAILGIGRSTVFELVAAGELPVVRIGRSVRVPRHALYGWIEERTERAPQRWAS
jgi:excisionase family DNA binding protein